MGQEIVYCFKCLSRLTSADFGQGKARRFGGRISCKACMPDLVASLSPAERAEFEREESAAVADPPSGSRLSRTPARHTAIPKSTTRLQHAPEPPRKGSGLMVGLVGGGLALVGLVVIVLTSTGGGGGDTPSPSTPERVASKAAAAPVPVSDPAREARVKKAKEAFEKATALVKAGSAPLDAQIAEAVKAVGLADDTPYYRDAVALQDLLVDRKKKVLPLEAEKLAEKAAPLLRSEDFKAAAAVYEEARGRHAASPWAALIDEGLLGVRKRADDAYRTLRSKAEEARRKGAEAEVKAALERVSTWSRPDLVADLEAALSKIVYEKPDSPALLAYRAQWREAAARAGAGEFEAARAAVVRAGKESADADVRKESEGDAEDFLRMRQLAADGLKALQEAGRGEKLSLEVFSEGAARRKISGTVAERDARRVRLSAAAGASEWAEWEDVSAVSKAAAVRNPSAEDRRVLAMLCLLEGDVNDARPILGGTKPESVARKWWEWAEGAAEKRPRVAPAEAAARKLFYEAEEEIGRAQTRGAAVAKYRALMAEHAGTKLYDGDKELIRKRVFETGQNYFFIGRALAAKGSFKLAGHDALGAVWASGADSETLDHFLDAEFYALPETGYRCWVYAGACCAEVFQFYYQASDLTSSGQKVDPGTTNAMPVRSGGRSLKATHAAHGGAKQAAKWEWLPLPLPRFPAPGLKKIRIVASHEGFSVGALVVSATRTSPPTEAELKAEAEKIKAELAVAEEGLVGWWRLDDGKGTSAADALGKGQTGAFKGSPKWAAGRFGGAVAFDGVGDEISAPLAFRGSAITVSAWIRHDTLGSRVMRYVTLGTEAAVLRHENKPGALHFYIQTDGKLRHLLVEKVLEEKKWHHVAGTWDGKTLRLYRDGTEVGTAAAGGKLSPADVVFITSAPEPIAGAIDEVRVYARALSADEIRALFAGAPAEPKPAAAADDRPWKPIFDGKSMDGLNFGNPQSWVIEEGALTPGPGPHEACKSKEHFGDGEVRIRFEAKPTGWMFFAVRQGAEGKFFVAANKTLVDSLLGKPHEVVFVCRGDTVTATLDGKPIGVETEGGRPRSGQLQWGAVDRGVRIFSIEYRELKP